MTRRYWFPAKAYGWGWGAPATWQGWVVFAGYLLLVLAGVPFIDSPGRLLWYMVYVALLSLALVAVCWRTGEPPRWRWGG